MVNVALVGEGVLASLDCGDGELRGAGVLRFDCGDGVYPKFVCGPGELLALACGDGVTPVLVLGE